MKLDKMMMVGALVAGMSMASSVMAGYTITIGYPGSSYGPWQAGSGGEFSVTLKGGLEYYVQNYSTYTKNVGGSVSPYGPSIETFCLEYPEHLGGYSSTYDVTVSSGAVNGGVSGGNPDYISGGTAWLYSEFAKGVLTGYDFANSGVGRKTSAEALQKIFWALEGEISMSDAVFNADTFGNAVVSKFWTGTIAGSIAAAKANAGVNNYNVAVMNPTTRPAPGTPIQSLLILVPDAGTTLTLLGIGFGSLGMLGRRFRK